MKHNLVNVEEMDEEMEGILALFRDQKVEDLESIESAATSTTSPAPTSTEIAAKMAEDATMDKALPTVPDIDDRAFSANSGTSGVSEGVVTGSSVEVNKLAPLSAPIIISPTSVVSWAEYQPTSTDDLLTIPDIDQHSPIPISEAPKPPLTTLWLQPFLHEGAMEAHRIYQEEIVRRGFKGKDSKWSTITHAERFEDKPIDLKEDESRSDGIFTFIPVKYSVQEDDTSSSSSSSSSSNSSSSSSSSTSTISDDDVHNSIPWSNAINCSYSQYMSITSPMVSLEAIWPHASPSENKRMGGANLTEGELYCTENINTSVHSVGEDHRRPSNTSSAIITDTRSLANSGNQADDHIHQGIITCSSSATPYGHDLHGNSSPWSNKRSYSHIIRSSSAMIPEGLSSRNVRMRGENLNTARRLPRVYSRQSIPQGISSPYAHVMSISSSSMVSSGEPPATPPTPENIWWSMRDVNAPTPGKTMRWTLDICHGLVKMNPDEVNSVQVCNTSTPIQESEDMRRRSIRGKGLEVHNKPVFEPSTIQAEDMRTRSIRGKGKEVYNKPVLDPSTIQAEVSQRWIQQHHKSEVDTSVFQFSPQEEAFAQQNFPKEAVGYDDQPERFTFPQSEHELAEMLGMPVAQHDLVEMLMRDIMGLELGGVGAGEGELPFNSSEFYGVTPQSEADNLREEITNGTQPQLNLNRSDSSQRRFYR